MDLTAKQIHALVEILGSIDVVWLPLRYNGVSMRQNSVGAALWERQKAFLSEGVPFAGSGNSAERKAHGRLVADLEAHGVIQVMRGHGRHNGVLLTPLGDDVARVMAMQPTLRDSWPVLRRAASFQCRQIREVWLLNLDSFDGCDYDETEAQALRLIDLEWVLCPAGASGWIGSNSDSQKHVSYFLKPEGREAITTRQRPELPEWLRGGPDTDVYSRDYSIALANEERRRNHWRPRLSNNLVIPLPVGAVPPLPEVVPLPEPDAAGGIA